MILCVDTKAMKCSPEVQKDIDLGELVSNHTNYYENEEEALKDGYVPLDFSVSVRSVYTNLVLQIDKGEEKRYYTNLSKVMPFVHNGYDLIMYLTSIGLMHSIEYSLGFDDLMMNHSQFQPIGLYNLDSPLINPIIYTHVIISDEGVKELTKYLKSDRKLVPISEIKEDGNLCALLRTLIEIKEEDKNESSDNN